MLKKSLLLMLLMALLVPWAVAQQALPYSYGFEDNDLSADGWTTTCISSNSGIKTSAAHSGNYGFVFNYSETSGYLVSPLLSGATTGVDLSFYYKEYSSSYGDEQFQVGYTTDASNTDASTFTYGDVVTASTSWQTYTNSFPAGTVRIAVKYIYNDAFYLYLDDFTFEASANCKVPTGLTATNLTTESATLGWTAPDPAPSNGYNVRYRTSVIEHPFYLDDFETNTLTGWTIYTDGEAPQSDGWYTINPETGLGFSAHSGSYCASAWSWSNQAYDADNWLISPQVPLTGTLRFYVRTNAGYPDEYEVLLSTTGTDESDFDVTLQAMAEAPATGVWEEVSIDLKSYSGNGYIAIHHVSNDCNYLLIDDFGIFDSPTPAGAWVNKTTSTNSLNISGLAVETTYDFEVQSNCGGETSEWASSQFTTNSNCMPVANLAVSDATTTTISLTWTDQNSGSASYIITDGDDNPVTVTNLTITGCTITGLTANTAYTFKVKADCGSTAETIQARTDCNALATLPYEEGFEASSVNFYCWDLDGFSRLNNSTYAHTGSVSLYAYNNLSYAILPATAANISELMLNFWYYNYYSGYDFGSLEVGYLTDEADYTTFVTVSTIDMSSSSDTYTQTNDIVFTGAPAGARIALKANPGTGGLQLMIDDFTLDVAPSCIKPTDLDVTGGLQAVVSWTGTAESFDIAFSDDPTVDPKTVIVGSSTTNSFNLYEVVTLTEGDYTVWVRGNCGSNGYSDWVSTSFHLGYCTPNITSHDGKGITAVSFGTGTEVVNNGDGTTSIPATAPYYGDYSSMIGAIPAGVTSTIAITTGTGSYPYTFVIWVDLDNDFTFEDEEVLYVGKASSGNGTLNATITIPGSQALGDYRMRIYGADSYFNSFYNNGTPDFSKPHDPCSSGTYRHAHDYTVRVLEAPSCLAPSGLDADNITTNSADLIWTANSGETSWNIYYKKTSETDYTELSNVKENPYTLTPLVANTNYEYYVVANCSPTEPSDPSAVYSFKTQCGAVTTFPWDEDFEGMTASTVPECWDNSASTAQEITSYPERIWGVYNYNSNNMIRMNNYYVHTGTALINSPSIEVPSTGVYQLTFDYAHNASCGAFKVNISDDNGTTWVEKGSYTKGSGTSYSNPGTFTSADPILLGDYAGQTIMIQFFANADYSSGAIFVDNILIEEAPNCIAPNGLGATPTTTSAELSWTAQSSESEWTIYYKKTSDESYTEVTNVKVNPYTLPGLTPATSYEYYVVANCSDTETSEPSAVFSFATECDNIIITDTDTYSEGFEDYPGVAYDATNGVVPVCWEPYTTGSVKPHVIASGGSYAYIHTGTKALTFYGYGYNYAAMPEFTNALSELRIKFWMRCESASSGTLTLGYITDEDDGTFNTFNVIETYAGVTTMTQRITDLNEVPATATRLVFRWYYGSQYSCCIDDVEVMLIPSCMDPSDLHATETTTTTATLEWTENGSATSWQICIDGDEENLIDADTNPFTVPGLTPSTAYTAKVRAYCSATDQSSWSAEISFTTKCEAVVVDATNPFFEGFEDTTFPPVCWENIVSGTRKWSRSTSSSSIHTGSGSAYSGYYGDIYLVMPDLAIANDDNATAVELTFWSKNTYVSYYDKNSVVLLDGTTETELWSPIEASSVWEKTTINLDAYKGQTISLAFKYEGNNAHGWYVDDVEVHFVYTFTMPITGYGTSPKGGYVLLATPVKDVDVTTTNMIASEAEDYDLYRFNQSAAAEWENYKNHSFNLESGKGYLYANKYDATLTFTGALYTGDGKIDLTYDGSAYFPGVNLIGNPYSTSAEVSKPYYRLNSDGSALKTETESYPVNAMEGVFVVATEAGETADFTVSSKAGKAIPTANIVISDGNRSFIDNAIIRFDEGSTLSKYQLSANSTKVYFPMDDNDYAIANADASGEMPLNFKAETTGKYTISFKLDGANLSYLHLIDKATGEDINLFTNPEYSFIGSPRDAEDRFIIRFSEASANDFFVYQNDDQIIVKGEGELQVYDVMGRFVGTYNVNGTEIINASQFANNVYIFRLVGETVKTQKIVVR